MPRICRLVGISKVDKDERVLVIVWTIIWKKRPCMCSLIEEKLMTTAQRERSSLHCAMSRNEAVVSKRGLGRLVMRFRELNPYLHASVSRMRP